jgi:anti-sigma-K factor RskA
VTEDEQKRLQEHLAICGACRETLKQYESVVDQAIPVFVAKEASKGLDGSDWSEDQQRQAEQAFFKRLEGTHRGEPNKSISTSEAFTYLRRLSPFSSESAWRHVWMLYAAGILLFVSLSFYAYRMGVHRGADPAKLAPQPPPSTQTSLEAQLSDAGHERQMARDETDQREKIIAELRQQSARQLAEINGLKAAKDRLENDLRAGDTARQDLVQQHSELAQKLDAAVSSSQALQQRVDSLAEQSARDAVRAKALDAKVSDLDQLLHDREVALDQKDELLAHDRDIRELMGARDIYIAEVHDVARDGQTQIPFGRVFYTKGKSLIFYAYDLNRQTELKRSGTFQAWGRRGPDREQAVNLGVFYEDNAAKKRWILKCDDPKTLAQIDAVFVTVEPDGGSHKPSSKSFLFAYLRVDPNHP